MSFIHDSLLRWLRDFRYTMRELGGWDIVPNVALVFTRDRTEALKAFDMRAMCAVL